MPTLSPLSLTVLCLAFPLLVRFFLRSLIAYQNLLRYLDIQKASWRYLAGGSDWYALRATYETYVSQWKSPRRLSVLMYGNLKYGFWWLFIVMGAGVAWGFVSTQGVEGRIVGAVILLLGLGLEATFLVRSMEETFAFASEQDVRVYGNSLIAQRLLHRRKGHWVLRSHP